LARALLGLNRITLFITSLKITPDFGLSAYLLQSHD
jgi:hypothetical protein